MLAIIQHVDKKAAILGYTQDPPINSLCHPNHVLKNQDEFEQYFPRTFVARGFMTVKCRMTSPMSLAEIKRKIRPKLENYHYFLPYATSSSTTSLVFLSLSPAYQ